MKKIILTLYSKTSFQSLLKIYKKYYILNSKIGYYNIN